MSGKRVVVRIAQVALILTGLLLCLRWFVDSLGGVIHLGYPVMAIALFGLSYLASRLA